MNNEIEANTPLGFVHNSNQFTVNISALIKTSCTGNICNIKIVNDWLNTKDCGCYGISSNTTNFVIQHAIIVVTVQCGKFKMDEYSSLKFSKLYFNTCILGSCKLYILQITESFIIMFAAMEECVDLINNNKGFTVVCWYNRGVINDKRLISAHKISNSGIIGGNPNFNSTEVEFQID